ncbi:hypothetical protein TL16_g01955 [Triparma laevis f. inornata]|uniref:RING-type domain-containing protein n=1 Tax=Triparma laevis f. inornata TaxID=1714386 RepID=A0A9W7DYS9_9STRA|nr:hypothetical protein TL16_g01955 [Triparma laevis f. inornata]
MGQTISSVLYSGRDQNEGLEVDAGWSKTLFLPGQEALLDCYTCSVCMEVVRDAVSCYCGHVFCSTCLTSSLNQKYACPVSRQMCTRVTPNIPVRKFVDLAQIRCPYDPPCEWTGKINNNQGHTCAGKVKASKASQALESEKKGWDDFVQSMIKNEDVNQRGGVSKLRKAIQHYDINRPIVFEMDGSAKTSLWLATFFGNLQVVKLLLEKEGVNLNSSKYFDDDAAAYYSILLEPFAEGSTPILVAASKGHKEIAKLLLEKGADFLREDDDGTTPLFAAIKSGRLEIVKLLLKRVGASEVNRVRGEDGRTPLLLAIDSGENVIGGLLLKNEFIDVNMADSYGRTPLNYTCTRKNKTMLKALLAMKNIDVNAVDLDNKTSLIQVIELRSEPWAEVEAIFDLLLAHEGVKVKTSFGSLVTSPLTVACNGGEKYMYMIKKLLEKDNSLVNDDGLHYLSPLILACRNGYEKVVKYLLGVDGINVNKASTHPYNKGTTALTVAIENASYECVALLLASKNIKAKDPYVHASGDEDERAIMGSGELERMDWNETLLFLALRYLINDKDQLASNMFADRMEGDDGENLQMLELNLRTVKREMIFSTLLDEGVGGGWTVGSNELVELILKNGADVNLEVEKAYDGYEDITPLLMAIIGGKIEVVETILGAEYVNLGAKADLQYRVYVDRRSKMYFLTGATPLYLAAHFGQKKIVEMLIPRLVPSSPGCGRSGGNLNERVEIDSEEGEGLPTSGFFAHSESEGLITPKKGKGTALDAAHWRGYSEVAEVLKAAGGVRHVKVKKKKEKAVKELTKKIVKVLDKEKRVREEEEDSLDVKRRKLEKKIVEMKGGGGGSGSLRGGGRPGSGYTPSWV